MTHLTCLHWSPHNTLHTFWRHSTTQTVESSLSWCQMLLAAHLPHTNDDQDAFLDDVDAATKIANTQQCAKLDESDRLRERKG